ncbi:MAG: ribonuclease HII [Prolixibacteraceae bacterium]|nr:ribonuclease HII [Prolixibacteraceae bacterium]
MIAKKHSANLRTYLNRQYVEAGCDEAGRGCLAGAVVAAAVILPPDFSHPLLNDSKQLTQKQRELLRPIIENESLAWAVAFVEAPVIDEINILNASFKAMNDAVKQLKIKPEYLLIDGNRFRNTTGIPHSCIVSGDALFKPIAAASILAKTHRDERMMQLHEKFPHYAWNKNKGYPTQAHRQAIVQNGITQWHRRTFNLINQQLELWT